MLNAEMDEHLQGEAGVGGQEGPSYQDFAEHYGVAILPARVRKPRDEAKVEVAVQGIERWIRGCPDFCVIGPYFPKEGAAALAEFEDGVWGRKYPAIAAAWRRQWEQVIPFFSYPLEVRKIIYTTNAIESLNSQLRRSVRARGHFLSDEAAMKLLYLQLREITKE